MAGESEGMCNPDVLSPRESESITRKSTVNFNREIESMTRHWPRVYWCVEWLVIPATTLAIVQTAAGGIVLSALASRPFELSIGLFLLLACWGIPAVTIGSVWRLAAAPIQIAASAVVVIVTSVALTH